MTTHAIDYDAQHALELAVGISRPRRVGTEAEVQVGRELAARLEAAGYQVQPEPFRFADAHATFLILEIIACQALVALTIALLALESPIYTVTATLLIVLLALVNGLNRAAQEGSLVVEGALPGAWSRLCQRLGKPYQAANYVAALPDSGSEPGGLHLLLVAHYDSKSQRMPLAARMTFFVLGIGGALLFALLMLLSPLLPVLVTPALLLGGLALLAGIPLWFLDLGNDSPGAIDNASSVGVVVALAEALARQPELCRRLDLRVLLTSAEEVSTMGAVAYVQRHAAELRRQDALGRLYVFNFDGVGVDGTLRWVGKGERPAAPDEPCLLRLVRQACIELSGEIKSFNLPGALYDHLPFAEAGLDAGTLVAVGKTSLGVHTPQDNPAALDLAGFERAGCVAVQVIQALLELPKLEQPVAELGVERSDIYAHDPLLRFLKEKVQLTPNAALLAAIGLGLADLLIAKAYNFWYSRAGIVGVLQDPPYLLTIFLIMPLFLRTYIWLPDGMCSLFHSLPRNRVVRRKDLPTYRDNVRILVRRYSRNWALVTLLTAILLQAAVTALNFTANYPAFGNILTARLVLLRIPYGLLALYAATFVVLRSVLNLDWAQLFRDVEPQINPLHPDQAAGYGAFTQYVSNLLGIFVAIATFFFTKALFQPVAGGVTFHPVYNGWILVSTVLYLVVGFYVFLYIPTGAARRAIRQAKRRQSEAIAEQYRTEQRILLDMTHQPGGSPEDVLALKTQMEKMKLLNETATLVDSVPSSPINRRMWQHFGLSYISIYLSTLVYNLLRAYFTPGIGEEFRQLLQNGTLGEILEGIVTILLTGRL